MCTAQVLAHNLARGYSTIVLRLVYSGDVDHVRRVQPSYGSHWPQPARCCRPRSGQPLEVPHHGRGGIGSGDTGSGELGSGDLHAAVSRRVFCLLAPVGDGKTGVVLPPTDSRRVYEQCTVRYDMFTWVAFVGGQPVITASVYVRVYSAVLSVACSSVRSTLSCTAVGY